MHMSGWCTRVSHDHGRFVHPWLHVLSGIMENPAYAGPVVHDHGKNMSLGASRVERRTAHAAASTALLGCDLRARSSRSPRSPLYRSEPLDPTEGPDAT